MFKTYVFQNQKYETDDMLKKCYHSYDKIIKSGEDIQIFKGGNNK